MDINFEGFLDRDKEFYSANNGFSMRSGYTVKVPKSLGQDTLNSLARDAGFSSLNDAISYRAA